MIDKDPEPTTLEKLYAKIDELIDFWENKYHDHGRPEVKLEEAARVLDWKRQTELREELTAIEKAAMLMDKKQ